jgi:lipopolysaccharide export system protein LptA
MFLAVALLSAGILAAQITRTGVGKNFMFPDYYPATNGVARKKSVVTGTEYRLVTNNIIALTRPRMEFFRPDGSNLQWTAIAREAVVDINTREVGGSSNAFFRTSDDAFFMTGMGFLWQQSNSVLIISNNSFAWIDIRTNAPAKNNKMKPLLAVSLLATARLSAAEMELPPTRPGLTITSMVSVLNLKSNDVLFSNNVLVAYPPAKTNEPMAYLRCDWLTAKRGTNNQIEEIVAHGRVAIDKGEQHGRGNYAIYTASNELTALVGMYDPADTNNPRPYLYASYFTNGAEVLKWKNEGDAIIYDRRTGELKTQGGRVHVPGESLQSFSSPLGTSTNKPRSDADRPKTNPPAAK